MSTIQDQLDKMNRKTRPKLFTSGRVIIGVLCLAAICALWTTEWMDRLQVFGNSLSPTFVTDKRIPGTEPVSTSPVDETEKIYDVPEPEDVPKSSDKDEDGAQEVGSYVDPSEMQLEDGETIKRENVPPELKPEEKTATEPTKSTRVEAVPPKPSIPQAVERLQICVISSNPRTASLFHSKTLRRKGDGKYDYFVTSKRCPRNTTNSPVTVKMLYQKSLSSYTSSQLDAMFNDPANLIIVMGDEFCRCPVEICSLRAHARQYYSQTYVDYATQHPSLDANPTVYLPLGPRVEFRPVDDSEVVASSQRSLLFNLIVSPTSPSRKKLASMVNKGNFESVFVHVTPAFAGNASEAKGFVAPEEYRKTLLDSQFTLCPAGHNPEAFRLFEASEAGSIPIIVKDEEYLEHFCKDSFAPLLASGAPFIVLNSWDELASALKPFQDDPQLLDERQRKLKTWYKRFWTEVARDFECSIAQNIDKIVKGSSGQGAVTSKFSADGYDMPECGDDESEEDDELALSQDLPKSEKVIPTTNENDDPSSNSLSTKVSPTPLIVGCGRTGTLSLSQYLVKSAGVKSIHEKMEPYSVSVSWLYAVPDASSYPFEGKKSPSFRRWKQKSLKKLGLPLFGPVVHVVRHPLKVISSTRRCFCGRGTRSTGLGQASDSKSWQFVDQNIKMPKPNLPYDSLLRSMTYWYEWNTMIPKKHNVAQRFRIEDLDPNQLVQTLGLQLAEGVELPHRVPRAPSHVSPEKEKELLPDATWKDMYKEDAILANKIFRLAKEYGYEAQAEKLEDLL